MRRPHPRPFATRVAAALPRLAVAVALALGVAGLGAGLSSCAAASQEDPREPVDLVVAPTELVLGLGQHGTLRATSTRGDVGGASWTAADPTIAAVAVSPDGTATITGAGVGATTVTAELAGTTVTVPVTITAAVLDAITVASTATALPRGTHATLTARGRYSDGHEADLTAMVTWASSDPTIASVLAGDVTAQAPGTATMSATLGAVTGTLALSVTAATLQGFTIAAPPAAIPRGLSYQLVATGTFSDATTADVTAQVTWTSSAPATATVDAAGLVRAVAPGTARIDGMIGSTRASATLQIGPAALATIAISPATLALPLGAQAALHAVGTYTDQTTADVTTLATWTATGATVTSTGVVTASAEGTARVTATIGAVHGDLDLAVGPPVVAQVRVAPATTTVPAGRVVAYAAQATRTDGTTFDATAQVAWAVDRPDLAAFATAAGSEGRLQALHPGAVAISASLASGGATLVGTAALTIDPPVLDAIVVAPAAATIALGQAQAFAATGRYSDGSEADVTGQVAWAATPSSVATIASGGAGAGRATSAGVGAAAIKATLGAVVGSATLTVTAAAPVSLALSVGDLALAQQERVQLHAILTFTDATTADVTAAATWTSDQPTVATVAAGQVDTQTVAQAATITATASGLSASLRVTVTTVACHPVINELQVAGTTAADEWAEVYNPCTTSQSVAGWTLVYRSAANLGAADTNVLATLSGALAPGELRLYAGVGYAGAVAADATWGGGSSGLVAAGGGGLGLRSAAAALIDAVAWGTVSAGHPFVEGAAAPAPAAGRPLARLPLDGVDAGQNATDFRLTNPTGPTTPRARNAP